MPPVALTQNRKLEMIKRHPLLSQHSRRELAEVAALADEIDLSAGKEIIREGTRGREFFFVIEGKVDVRKGGRKLTTLDAGDFVGEIALVSDIPRSASVTTATPVRALVITESSFRRLLRDAPGIQLKVLQALAARVAENSRAAATL